MGEKCPKWEKSGATQKIASVFVTKRHTHTQETSGQRRKAVPRTVIDIHIVAAPPVGAALSFSLLI